MIEAKAKGNNECTEEKEDVVNKPSHYRHGKFEVIDEMIIAFGVVATFKFCIMNAWKYRSRAPFKGKLEEDMEKASRYMEMARQIQENNKEILEGVPSLIKEEK